MGHIKLFEEWNEEIEIDNQYEDALSEKWSEKYKKSIDCSNPKGFSQKAHCAGRKKRKNKKRVKLFVEWNAEYELNETLETFMKEQMALLGTPQEDIQKFEQELKKTLGDNAEVSVEKKPIEEVSLDNKKVEQELKKDPPAESVVILKVKEPNSSLPHTFVIPEKKTTKPKLNPTGNIALPTIYVTKDDAVDINIGGLRNALNSVAKGKDFDIDRLTAKVSIKHSF